MLTVSFPPLAAQPRLGQPSPVGRRIMRVQRVQRARVGYSVCAGLTWSDLVKLVSRVARLDRDTTTQTPATLVAFAGN